MEEQEFYRPIVKTFEDPLITLDLLKKVPEIININYDLYTLTVTIWFPEEKSRIYIIFKGVEGFRVLDERELLEFWNPDVRVNGWLWVVKKGGWFSLEKLRKGFVSGYQHMDSKQEYLLVGINDCVNVISYDKPTIMTSK